MGVYDCMCVRVGLCVCARELSVHLTLIKARARLQGTRSARVSLVTSDKLLKSASQQAGNEPNSSRRVKNNS